jgi:hypothetical protein
MVSIIGSSAGRHGSSGGLGMAEGALAQPRDAKARRAVRVGAGDLGVGAHPVVGVRGRCLAGSSGSSAASEYIENGWPGGKCSSLAAHLEPVAGLGVALDLRALRAPRPRRAGRRARKRRRCDRWWGRRPSSLGYARAPMKSSSLLVAREVTKVFGGHRAVDGVSFVLERGCIGGLIGPNGAGKTTLFNCLAGHLARPRARSSSTACRSPAPHPRGCSRPASHAPSRSRARFRR